MGKRPKAPSEYAKVVVGPKKIVKKQDGFERIKDPYKCKYCPKVLNSKSSKYRHMETCEVKITLSKKISSEENQIGRSKTHVEELIEDISRDLKLAD